MNNIVDQKIVLRKKQFKIRREIFKNTLTHFNINLIEILFNKLRKETFNIFSSFISIYSEINTKELNYYLLEKQKILCLPCVSPNQSHLIFRRYNFNQKLVKGKFNILEPSDDNELLIPDILFVPCLAFDKNGYRLGYGGGYYDKTFDYLIKNKKKFISVGYAFEDQKLSSLPIDKYDIKLNYVMTEKNIYSYL